MGNLLDIYSSSKNVFEEEYTVFDDFPTSRFYFDKWPSATGIGGQVLPEWVAEC
jgi:hypothetical protein